jgi:hypothetical protein
MMLRFQRGFLVAREVFFFFFSYSHPLTKALNAAEVFTFGEVMIENAVILLPFCL